MTTMILVTTGGFHGDRTIMETVDPREAWRAINRWGHSHRPCECGAPSIFIVDDAGVRWGSGGFPCVDAPAAVFALSRSLYEAAS